MNTRVMQENLAKLGFIYTGEVVDRFGNVLQRGEDHNLLPVESLSYLANLILGVGNVQAPWYVGVFAGNYTPTSATKATDLPGSVVESVLYSQVSRPQWAGVHNGTGLITNAADRAEFTFTADATLYGGFLVSDNNKGSGSGILLSIARFATPYAVPSGSTFKLGVAISLVS